MCPTVSVPENTTDRDDGWRAFRVKGTLDFSLTGILARLSAVLAENKIGIFAVQTTSSPRAPILTARSPRCERQGTK